MHGVLAEFLRNSVVKEFEDENGSQHMSRSVSLEPVHVLINAVSKLCESALSWSQGK